MRPSGPLNAAIAIVGEAPGENEIRTGTPFSGPSGEVLNGMLAEAGIARSECFVTNVCQARPPGNDISPWVSHNRGKPSTPGDWVYHEGLWLHRPIVEGLQQLESEMRLVKPRIVIGVGNLALWAFTGKWGITNWRGSQFSPEQTRFGTAFLPTYHPAAVIRQWDLRFITVHDIRRAKGMLNGFSKPAYNFHVRPSLDTVMGVLFNLFSLAVEAPLTLTVDIETRWGHIACIGLAWSKNDAICIPLMCVERREGYWSVEEEAAILLRLSTVLQHRNVRCVGQNFLYDVQYLYRHYHFLPRFAGDTMLAQHVCWPGMPKGLDFLSSMYCKYHMFWKAEGKDWHKSMQEDILWEYNCKDCVITYEVWEELTDLARKLGLEEQLRFQLELWPEVLKTMLRGIRVDSDRRAKLKGEIGDAIKIRNEEVARILGHPLNHKSPLQMRKLLYDDLHLPPQRNRKTGEVTTNDEALEKLATKEPLVAPLISRIRELRSLGVFLSTFVEASPDSFDGRMRCYFNPAGTETFRLSSSEDAFGSGMNLQNLPKGDEE